LLQPEGNLLEKTYEIEVTEDEYTLFCYEGEDCVWFQSFETFETAVQFGIHYVENGLTSD
jgi:hypothetical protein